MSEVTGIAWTDHSWSPWHGCTEVSVGEKGACVFCYARDLNHRYGFDNWGAGKPRRALSENHWRQPLKWDKAAAAAGETRFVFPSMCDPWDNEVPIEWLRRFLDLIDATPHLTWLLLTKRAPNIVKRMREAGRDLPKNVALGITVVTQDEYDRDMRHLQAAKRLLGARLAFLSIEPMMGPIDLTTAPRGDGQGHSRPLDGRFDFERVDWVICGGESGPSPRPMQESWALALRDQCTAADVPFFFKQWGGRTPKANGKELDGREWCERPMLTASASLTAEHEDTGNA